MHRAHLLQSGLLGRAANDDLVDASSDQEDTKCLIALFSGQGVDRLQKVSLKNFNGQINRKVEVCARNIPAFQYCYLYELYELVERGQIIALQRSFVSLHFGREWG